MYILPVLTFSSVLLLASADFISPCPDKFKYDTEEAGIWKGTLTVTSEDDLHGVWIRLVLDNKYLNVTIPDNSMEAVPSDGNEVLIRNRNILLKANTPKVIPVLVKYEGSTVPKVTGYRLNAKVVCPPPANRSPTYYFSDSIKSEEFLKTVLVKNPSKSPAAKCGYAQPANKDVNDPWKAQLYLLNNNVESHVCEATLISENHLITAAHCVTYRESNEKVQENVWRVRLGENTKKDTLVETGIKKIVVYPGYQLAGLMNDIAILELTKPVDVNDFVRPICLADADDNDNKRGIIQEDKLSEDKDGKKHKHVSAEVQELNGEECVNRIPELASLVSDNAYCATYVRDESECVGKSGSSLTASSGERMELRGIVTLDAKLQKKPECNPSTTLVLVKVTRYLKWIKSVIN